MERKIGEIYEHNGEWYQCIKQPEDFIGEVCKICAFQGTENCDIDECSDSFRSDKQDVIFKKLEKVGKPYKFNGHIFQAYRTFEVPIFTENYVTVRELGNDSKISIEIKQNKENMEENKLNLKPFDIQKAREGKPICTRDGRKARIICFDRVNAKPILALVTSPDGKGEDVFDYFVSGKRRTNALRSNLDLMMLPEKKEGWVNIYRGQVYNTFEKAEEARKIAEHGGDNCLKTIKIDWEE